MQSAMIEAKGDIKINSTPDELVCYANVATVLISSDDAIFHFGLRDTENPTQGKSRAVIYVTLAHAKRIAAALAQSIKAYEDTFGEIVTDPFAKLSDEQRKGLLKQR